MSTRFLSDAEIMRLEGWPEAIDPESLGRYFHLDGNDVGFVRRQNGASGQLGIALQLCALRWLGFFPDDLPAAPEEAIGCLADALDVRARAIFDYSVRPQTRWEHRPLVRDHAGFAAVSEPALAPVREWLVEQAMEHERPSLLFSEMCAELRRRGIERPSVTEVMRHVGWARERAHERTFERLSRQLTPAACAMLDGLLATEKGQSRHAWLRARPTAVSAAAMRRELEKRAFLIETIGADRFDLSALPPNRRSWLAQTGRQQTNQALARMAPQRRYPVLMAFCVEALARASDDAIEVFDRALGAADRAAQRKRDELERRGRRDIQTTVRRFIDLSYELCAAYELRSALRAGRVWVPGSHRHADPSSLLLPEDRWQETKAEFAAAVERPVDGTQRLDALAEEQHELLERLASERDTTAEAHLADGDIVLDAAEPGDDGRMRALIEPMLPEVDLPELLIEVDGWTGFTEHLVPLSGNRRRSADMPCLLYAVILAQATNLGLTGMARASQYSYQQLEWAWEQLCREDILTAASARLVDYHHGLPLTQTWGAGRLSSSDGQRFAARTRGPGVASLPRYFGHRRRGMQIYSWTSDQYSQYASKVITATVRDATHTLDGILDNQTVLPIEQHTTDTHGYTEMIFGAYDLLGLRFAPGIRDLDRQRLYQHGTPSAVETAELLKHKIRPELILPYWDQLLRIAASLRHGWAPASLLLARRQAGSRRNPLA